ncbi:hypothetical protein [Cyanobium sp. ATX 6F1]|uniref:hypothetical protein n=1 Tax=unclassified Cyanobium TaxID=2627006 RepID=UPI0020CE17A9|nr:hypothetical protein [Cyanobium sp. ATX 6F1]MCP9916654.1 hypothetical protein [Cyanobium sp. ATX 6F1]
MRTTLDIEDDLLAAAKELAMRQGTSAGKVVSRLIRAALSSQVTEAGSGGITRSSSVAGFRPFNASTQKLVTNEQVDQLRDQDGI